VFSGTLSPVACQEELDEKPIQDQHLATLTYHHLIKGTIVLHIAE
jgi:hypothetical protein